MDAAVLEPEASPADAAAERVPTWRLALPGVVVGAVSALYRLDHQGLWLDEAYTLGSVHQLRSAVPATSWTMSAYYAVMRVWILVSDGVWWMRLPSVLAAVAAIAVTVATARRLAGAAVARLTGVLLALSPMWLTYAREARSYGFVMLAVATTWWALDHALVDDDPAGRRRWWALHSAAAAVLPFLHGLTILQLVPQLVLLVIVRPDLRTWARAGRGIGLAALATAVLARSASSTVGEWVSPLSLGQVGGTLEHLLSRWAVVCALLTLVVLVGGATCVAMAVRAPERAERARAVVPLLWGVAPLLLVAAVSVVRPSLVARYAVGVVPGVALVMAIALLSAWTGTWRPSVVRTAVVIGVVAALAAGHVAIHAEPQDGWTYAARVVAADIRPDDTLVLSRETTTRPPFEAAWRDVDAATEPMLLPDDRPLGEVLRFEPGEVDNTVRWNQARGAERIWLVADTERLELDRLPSLTTAGTAGRPASHREVRRWHAPGSTIFVVLLVPVAPGP